MGFYSTGLQYRKVSTLRCVIDLSYSWGSYSRKVQESILYVWDQVLTEWSDSDASLDPNIAAGLVHYIAKAIASTESGLVFLRARGYLLAGTLAKHSAGVLGDQCKVFLEQTIQAATQDSDGVVQISCLKVLQK